MRSNRMLSRREGGTARPGLLVCLDAQLCPGIDAASKSTCRLTRLGNALKPRRPTSHVSFREFQRISKDSCFFRRWTHRFTQKQKTRTDAIMIVVNTSPRPYLGRCAPLHSRWPTSIVRGRAQVNSRREVLPALRGGSTQGRNEKETRNGRR